MPITPIMFDGRHLGDLHVPPDTDPELLAGALRQLATPPEWATIGATLAALGPHRLAIAARAIMAAATGGRGVSAEEEEHIGQWFGGIVDDAIRRGGLDAAVAIWEVLAGDRHVDSSHGRLARCPWVAEVPHPPQGFSFELAEPNAPGRPGRPALDLDEVTTFLAKLRAAAPGYVLTAIACASDTDLHELRELTLADDHMLEEFRPWGVDLAAEVSASELLEDARSMLTWRHLSNAEACSGFADWAHGIAGMVAEHALSPVLRIGAVAWLARVALRPAADAAADAATDAARTYLPPEAEAPRAEPSPEQAAPQSHDQAAQAPDERSLVRNVAALAAMGWHVIELRPRRAAAIVLWRVTIERYDETVTVTISQAADPDSAIAELVRYVQVDA